MTLHLQLATAPQIERAGRPAQALAPRDALLLAWLVIEGPTTRARMATLLWPDSTEELARAALRQRLWRLHKALGFELLGDDPVLRLPDGVTDDLSGSDELLGELHLPVAPELDAWLENQREQRRTHERNEMLVRAQAFEDAGDAAAALPVAEALLRREPLSEVAHRRLMRLHYLRGDRAAALVAFDRCEQLLKDEIGTRPSAPTLALLATIEASQPVGSLAVRLPLPASVLRPPRTVGRDAELARLEAAWSAANVGTVIGEAGMGKTRLLQDFMQRHPGMVRAAGRPGDSGVPLATLARLLRAVNERASPATAALEAETRREIARVLPELAQAAQRESTVPRLDLHRAVVAFLRASGVPGLVVDDLHFADDASLDMLQSVIAGDGDNDAPGNGPRWLLALRPAEAGAPARQLQHTLSELARLEPVRLSALSAADLGRLVDDLALPGVSGAALAPLLWQRTGGNPLFVLETLKQAWAEGGVDRLSTAGALPRATSVDQLIDVRVASLSPAALALARVASIAGVDFRIALAEQVLGTSAMQFADALIELESAQVLRGTQFAHDLVFDAVLRSVPGAIAAHTHAQVAGWLEAHAGEAARIAQHWILAGQPPRAIPWLGRAAEHAAQALRNVEQLAFLERMALAQAEAGLADDAFATQLKVLEISADIDVGNPAALARYDVLDALVHNESQRLQAALRHLDRLVRQVRDDEARTLARTVVRDAMRAGEVALAMEAHVLMIVVEWRCDRATDALGHARICEAWVEENGELATRGQLHAYMGLLYARLGPLGEAIAHHERAVAITREMAVPSYLAITLDALAQALSLMGRSKMARKRSEEALLLAASHETSPTVSGGAWRTRASIELRLGHFHDALHALRESRRIGGSLTESALLGPPTDIYEALAWSLLGQWSRVGQIVDRLAGNAGLTLNQRANVARLRFLMGLGQGRCEPEHLRAAIALLADHDDLRFILMNWLAPTLPTAEGLALLDEVRAMAVPMNLDAHVLVSHLRGAQIAAATDPELAARHARRARELGGEIDLGTHTAADLPLQCSRAHFAAGEHAIARDLLQQGLDALHASARDHVPAEFRDGFLERNPINRELLALGARHGLRHGG